MLRMVQTFVCVCVCQNNWRCLLLVREAEKLRTSLSRLHCMLSGENAWPVVPVGPIPACSALYLVWPYSCRGGTVSSRCRVFCHSISFPRSSVGMQTHRSAVTAPPCLPDSQSFPRYKKIRQSAIVYSSGVPSLHAGSTAERWGLHSHAEHGSDQYRGHPAQAAIIAYKDSPCGAIPLRSIDALRKPPLHSHHARFT
jgi:hypothetical protein